MARIRTVKPEFFTSEDIVALSPLARLLYIATWCEADKEGRLLWKPGTFKLRYFPADGCDINALCDELVKRGLVVLYGEGLAYIPSFGRHQHINPRESASTLPEPTTKTAKSTRAARVTTRHDASARVGDAQGGREGKGKEGNNSTEAIASVSLARPSKKAPPGFELSDDLKAWAAENTPSVDADAELAKLKDHTFSTARSDWPGTVRNWLRKAQEDAQAKAQRIRRPPPDEPDWRREQRERNEAFLGPAAAKRRTSTVIDMDASDASTRLVG